MRIDKEDTALSRCREDKTRLTGDDNEPSTKRSWGRKGKEKEKEGGREKKEGSGTMNILRAPPITLGSIDEWKETAIEDRTIGNDEFLSIFHQVYRLRSVLSFFVFRIDRLRHFRWENRDEANSEWNDRVGITIRFESQNSVEWYLSYKTSFKETKHLPSDKENFVNNQHS